MMFYPKESGILDIVCDASGLAQLEPKWLRTHCLNLYNSVLPGFSSGEMPAAWKPAVVDVEMDLVVVVSTCVWQVFFPALQWRVRFAAATLSTCWRAFVDV